MTVLGIYLPVSVNISNRVELYVSPVPLIARSPSSYRLHVRLSPHLPEALIPLAFTPTVSKHARIAVNINAKKIRFFIMCLPLDS